MKYRMAIGALGWSVVACLYTAPAVAKSKAAGLRGNPGQFFGPDAYPVEAMRLHQEGRVVAKLWVDRLGKVASCSITISSGSPSLDKATCDIALEKITYEPATDDKGEAIAATATLPVHWALPSGPMDASLPKNMSVVTTMSFDASGTVLACNSVTEPPLPMPSDGCQRYVVGTPSGYKWEREGRPVGGTIKERITFEIDLDP